VSDAEQIINQSAHTHACKKLHALSRRHRRRLPLVTATVDQSNSPSVSQSASQSFIGADIAVQTTSFGRTWRNVRNKYETVCAYV